MRRPYRQEGLSPRDQKVIEIERRLGPTPSALPLKLDAAREQLGIDAKTYGFVVTALIDDPRAHAFDPRTMSRLKELRDQHREAWDGNSEPRGRPFRVGH